MFDVFDPSVTFANTLRAGGVFALIALHVGVLGYWSTRWLGFRAADFWSELCVRVGAGLAILGFGILAAGHLNGLHRAVAYASSAAMFVGLLASWGHLVGWTRVAASEIRGAFRENWFLVLACAGMAVLVVVCGLRAGWWVDEIEYHYAAPLLWAEHGKWVPSPYHNTNGPALAEVLFTFPALFKSDVAAHWMHSTCLLMLAAGCAGLSRRAGGSAIGALAAVLSVPVVVNQSHVAYSDIAAGGFAIAGYVALFCGKRDGPPGLAAPAPGAASIAVASLLLIAAVSVKATTVYALPVATLYVAWPMLKRGLTFADRAAWFRRGVALSAPVILMLGIWTVRSYYLKGGEFWFEEVQGLTAHSADDPMWLTGEKVARVPTTGDLAMLPAVPVLVTVMGQMEPYGGRTGLLLLAFVPVGLIAVRRLPDAQRHLVYWMLAAAAAYFFGLGPTGIKTRYHLFVWTMFAVVAGIGFKFMNDYRRESSLARVGLLVFYVLVTFGMGDIAHVIGRRLTRFYA